MPIDYSKYPKDWKTVIVPAILKRANNKCEVCGLKNKQVIYSCPIKSMNGKGRYNIYNIWITSKGDLIRLKPLLYGEYKKVRVVLTIAHLDHDEHNNQIQYDRLKAMCQKCHLAYDAEEKYRRACICAAE